MEESEITSISGAATQEMEASDITSIAGGATQGLAGIAMGVIGYYQRKKAAEMEKNLVRPELNVPDYLQGYMTEAERQSQVGLPEAQRQRYIDQINRNATYSIAGNLDRNVGLQGVSAANAQLNDANANLLTMDAQARMQNQANFQNAQLNYGNFKNDKFSREFAYNQDEPYRNKAAAIRALYGAGMQNGAAGLQTVADSGATLAGGQGSGMNSNPYKVDPNQYTGYGARGTEVQPIPTKTAQVPVNYNYGLAPMNSGYGAPTQQQWQNQNPNYYYVRK